VQKRRRLALGSFVIIAVVAACRSKEQAAPPVSKQEAPPSAAPATTTVPTTIPTPPPVWRAARWGMKKDELVAAFPGEAQRLEQPADFGRKGEGSTDVAIPAYEIEGTKFRVLFGFDGDALTRIHLSAARAGDATCGDLEKQLTQEHSAPSERSTTQTNIRREQILWKRPDQTITLVCTEALSLGYRTVTLEYITPKG
jgi:hypothetical protein